MRLEPRESLERAPSSTNLIENLFSRVRERRTHLGYLEVPLQAELEEREQRLIERRLREAIKHVGGGPNLNIKVGQAGLSKSPGFPAHAGIGRSLTQVRAWPERLPFIRPSPFREGLYLKPVGLAESRSTSLPLRRRLASSRTLA
jgi:hypothetical protein